MHNHASARHKAAVGLVTGVVMPFPVRMIYILTHLIKYAIMYKIDL